MTVLLHVLHAGLVIGGALVVGYLLRPQKSVTPAGPPTEIDVLRAAAAQGSLVGLARERALREARTDQRVRAATAPPRALLQVASVCCIVSAGIHAAISPAHFDEGLRFGVFFVALTAVQIALGCTVLVRSSEHVVTATALINGAVVLLWALTRTVTLPFGLAAQETIGMLDLTCSAIEVVAVVCCVSWLRGVRAPRVTLLVVEDEASYAVSGGH